MSDDLRPASEASTPDSGPAIPSASESSAPEASDGNDSRAEDSPAKDSSAESSAPEAQPAEDSAIAEPVAEPVTEVQRARVILRARMARPFFGRHPWVFASAIARIEGEAKDGDEVDLYSKEGQFIARGLINSRSRIRVRLYTWDESQPLDEAFWSQQLDRAIALRKQLFPVFGSQTAFRLVASEGDGLSGLTVDRFGDWLLVQLTSRALAARQDLLFNLLEQKLSPRGIWLRTEKGIRELEGLEARDGLVRGAQPPRPIFLEEDGLQFGADVVEGQKTGFYLDQRENRLAAARYLSGSRVLDCFSYSGGFGIAAAARGGAKQVLCVDVSEPALQLARANAELNGLGDRLTFRKGRAGEVLTELREAGEQFDMVVLDPPRMARHRQSVSQALKGYFNLNRKAVDLLPPGGILVTCSCSGLVDREEFVSMLAAVAEDSGRPIQLLEVRGSSADHPVSVSCPESAYLKCVIARVL